MKNSVKFLLLTVMFLLPQNFLLAESIRGKVISIADGDTLTILKDSKQIKIRLFGIDAPEKAQPFGTRSKQYLSQLVFGKVVRVEKFGIDQYGRTLGEIFNAEEDSSVNIKMVEAGLAWWYKRYAEDRKDLRRAEEQARKENLGLWFGIDPDPPWKWRDQRR